MKLDCAYNKRKSEVRNRQSEEESKKFAKLAQTREQLKEMVRLGGKFVLPSQRA